MRKEEESWTPLAGKGDECNHNHTCMLQYSTIQRRKGAITMMRRHTCMSGAVKVSRGLQISANASPTCRSKARAALTVV